MENRGLLKQMIPIYLASFVAWIHNIVYTPLAYMYNTYPNQEKLVMLIAVIPGVVAMGAGLIAGKIMKRSGEKNLVLFSLCTMIIGGFGVFFSWT